MFRAPALVLSLLLPAWGILAVPSPAAAPPPAQRFGRLSNDDAWRLLPRREPPLPAWARALAGPLPRTTAGMLQLDRLHRADNPLGAMFAAQLRWTAADELGCDYARRYAEFDLRRAGASDRDVKRLNGAAHELPRAERTALAFARKLTRAGYSLTDAELTELLDLFGAEKVVAIVHTVALANFQNRIYLALGVAVEPDGPYPPLDVHFDPSKPSNVPVPARPPWGKWRKSESAQTAEAPPPPGWQDRTAAELEKLLQQQKGRTSRIPVPGLERFARIPPESRGQATRIVWTRISMGYQPVLTKTWFDCMGLFHQESRLDRVFANSYFWVITRSNECFY
jgi:alkylhydroperoxidase family enzyme